jgi:uncharacterized membrane protein
MKDLLIAVSDLCITAIDALALIVIVVGTAEAAVKGFAMMSSPSSRERRDVWLRYARWLVAGLTFQLAADIIETSIAPDWDDIGRLAVIAIIRTFLNYFLEKDLNEVRERQREGEPRKTAKPAGARTDICGSEVMRRPAVFQQAD